MFQLPHQPPSPSPSHTASIIALLLFHAHSTHMSACLHLCNFHTPIPSARTGVPWSCLAFHTSLPLAMAILSRCWKMSNRILPSMLHWLLPGSGEHPIRVFGGCRISLTISCFSGFSPAALNTSFRLWRLSKLPHNLLLHWLLPNNCRTPHSSSTFSGRCEDPIRASGKVTSPAFFWRCRTPHSLVGKGLPASSGLCRRPHSRL